MEDNNEKKMDDSEKKIEVTIVPHQVVRGADGNAVTRIPEIVKEDGTVVRFKIGDK
jgi:hypothetical protein